MNKNIFVISASLLLIGFLIFFLLPNEKKKIHKRLNQIEEIASKSTDETSLQSMMKATQLASFFTDPCQISVEGRNFEGTFPRKEIVGYINLARGSFSNINVRFYDVSINLKDKLSAKVHVTMRLTGKEDNGKWGESHEVSMFMKKQEGEWMLAEGEIMRAQQN